ncbi:CRM-domain containing factor CFM3, chloroplastic/mitochondrial isoform X2 [Primulina eburnea]|uniref:CRM-domain containing factor CFM3, chloroplastic/mitochondrial isoform X2 n=1 Tax=Primulina eburnea TaxID=1245227 RepID=UPI003C6C2DA3
MMTSSTAKLTELPPHIFSTLSRMPPHYSLIVFKPISSALRSTKVPKTFPRRPNTAKEPEKNSSWINKWSSPPKGKGSRPEPVSKRAEQPPVETRVGTTAIDRIVLRLRNLGLGSDDERDLGDVAGGLDSDSNSNLDGMGNCAVEDEKLGDLLKRDWVRPDTFLVENEGDYLLPWERGKDDNDEDLDDVGVGVKKRAVKAPTLADLTIEDEVLRRLRRMGMTLRERINVPKAGVTGEVLEKIHDTWRKCELVRLKFHEDLAHDMRTAHEIVERRTGGLVTWRSGSVMLVFRGTNYDGPILKPDRGNIETIFVPTVSPAYNSAASNSNVSKPLVKNPYPVMTCRDETMTEEEVEYNLLLDGLGPRFEDWWGTGVLPVDADLLPQTIPEYKTPFRLLPTGMRPRLTNAEMTDLRKLAKTLPCHFALGRNRNHQGLAAAILKLWEKSLVVKIAVKRGIQNTNNEIMAEELKKLTGGVLLLRNKYFIVMYRGKDFLPPSVATALAERQELTKQVQDGEEKVRVGPAAFSVCEDKEALAGTLAEFYEAQARWGTEISSEEHQKMIEEATQAKSARVVGRLEHKLAISQAKKLKAETLLSKIVSSWMPASPSDDQETITEEERVMYRKVGLRMKAYLPLGIRGVFDGVIENMHLHWKHRELVKLISKEKELSFVEETARLLEYESGGILVSIDRVPKGHAVVFYRGKNYYRPLTLRPRNLLTKAKALKRRIALQRYEALSQHIYELEKNIEQIKQDMGGSNNVENSKPSNNVENSKPGKLQDHDQFNGSFADDSEDEDSIMRSDGDEDAEDNLEDDEDSEFSSFEDF